MKFKVFIGRNYNHCITYHSSHHIISLTMFSKQKQQKIKPIKPISGFPELLPNEEIILQRSMKQIKEIYELYGYVPLETRLGEDLEILNRKGIENKELYIMKRLCPDEEPKKNKKQLALRFDLTVPFGRYVAENKGKLTFPYKRYQGQKVWRGEHAIAAKGRSREFWQLDIDVTDRDSVSIHYDAEFPAIIYKILSDVFKLDKFLIKINNRKVLEGLFIMNGVKDNKKIKKAINIIDSIEKVSSNETISKLNTIGLSKEQATKLFSLFNTIKQMSPSNAIKKLYTLFDKNNSSPMLTAGLKELSTVIEGVIAQNVPETHFCVDLSIARGLDYYTGTVYETVLTDNMEIGSICSGGRYDDLISTITGNPNDKFPGVGISFGITRLITALIKTNHLKANKNTVSKVLIAVLDPNITAKYQKLANKFRQHGIKTDVYYTHKTKLKKQIKYADKQGHELMIFASEKELDKGIMQVKFLNDVNSENKEEYFTEVDGKQVKRIRYLNNNQKTVIISDFIKSLKNKSKPIVIIDIKSVEEFKPHEENVVDMYKNIFREPPYNEFFTKNEIKKEFTDVIESKGHVSIGTITTGFILALAYENWDGKNEFVTRRLYDPKNTLYLADLGVRIDLRGRCFGKQLLEDFLNKNKTKDIILRTSKVGNDKVIALYKKYNFKVWNDYVEKTYSVKLNGEKEYDERVYMFKKHDF